MEKVVGSIPPSLTSSIDKRPSNKLSNKPGRKLGITWGQYLGKPECPYMRRWVLNFGVFSIRLHQWFFGDDPRAFHDHSWKFIVLVLRGGYSDVTESGEEKLSVGSIRFRPALHRHTVRVNEGGCTTLVITGPEVRRWGFWVKNKFRVSWRYFHQYGHHHCE